MPETLDPFTRAYLQTALWAETDNATEQGGEAFERNYSEADDWPEPFAAQLTDACKAFGSFDLYLGDDGLIHGS